MKHLLLTTIAAVVLVGCGESQQSSTPVEAKPVKLVPEAKPVNPKANKALLNAVKKGEIEAAKQAITDGANLNTKDERGTTPIHIAAGRGNLGLMKLLVKKGANIETKNDNGDSLLHMASISAQKDVFEYLVEKGANVNAKNRDGTTPLHVANYHEEVASFLIKNGADVNAKDGFGSTPIFLINSPEVVKILIRNGGDVNAVDRFGTTPLDSALSQSEALKITIPDVSLRLKEIADLLRKHGGKTSAELKAEGK